MSNEKVLNLSIGDLAEQLGAEITGDASLKVSGVSSLDLAGAEDVSFVTSVNMPTKRRIQKQRRSWSARS